METLSASIFLHCWSQLKTVFEVSSDLNFMSTLLTMITYLEASQKYSEHKLICCIGITRRVIGQPLNSFISFISSIEKYDNCGLIG